MIGNPNSGSDPYADAAPDEPTEKPTEDPQEERGEEATAVIPKALLGGNDFAVGEEVVLEIVQLTEDGAVVKYAGDGGGEEMEEDPTMEQAPAPGGEMAAMME